MNDPYMAKKALEMLLDAPEGQLDPLLKPDIKQMIETDNITDSTIQFLLDSIVHTGGASQFVITLLEGFLGPRTRA